jgi:ParB/RepB/Spo0J family partition protein
MTTPSEIAQQSDLGYHYLPLSSIDASPTNPRKHFDKQKLDELAESIIRLGVLQPIVVRPRGERYEIVAGERRFRAARQVALEAIPCTVRDLDDKSTLEVQVVENLQRDDLHPLEEAEGYAALLRDHGYDADTLALKIGKSRSYVYGRMKLSELCESGKRALYAGEMSHSVALLVARIPDAKLQVKAVHRVTDDQNQHNRREMSYREAAEYIQREFMLRLASAPFDTASATLVAAAGACVTCPMRTGNQSELFADVQSADVCTNPSCYRSKVDAHLEDEAKKNGWKALTGAQSKKAFQFGRVDYSGEFVAVDDTAQHLGQLNKKYKDVVPKETPIYLGRDERGTVHKLYSKADLPKQKDRTQSTGSAAASSKKWERARELESLTEKIIGATLLDAVKTKKPKLEAAFPYIAQLIAIDRRHRLNENLNLLGRDGKAVKGNIRDVDVVGLLKPLSPAQLLSLVILLLSDEAFNGTPGELSAPIVSLCKFLGVDLPSAVETATSALKSKWDAEDAKKKVAKKKPAKKKTGKVASK